MEEYWSRKGRPMLLTALEAVCDTVGEELAANARQLETSRNASLLEEIGQLKAAAARAEHLEKENRSLLQEIEHLRKKQSNRSNDFALGAPEDHGPTGLRPALAEKPVNIQTSTPLSSSTNRPKKPNLEQQYSKLAKQHAVIGERYKETQQLARKYRESQETWIKYAESLEVKVQKLETKLQRRKGPLAAGTSAPSTAKPRSAAHVAGHVLSGQTAVGSGLASPNPASDTGRETLEREPTRDALDRAGRTVDEETQDESEGAYKLPQLPSGMATEAPATVKEEPSSDGPVVVSERAVRKRRHPADDADNPTPPRRIKREQTNSSDPVVTWEAPVFRPHESIDLDEEEQEVPTPRKQRSEDQQYLREDETATRGENRPASQPDIPNKSLPGERRSDTPSRKLENLSGDPPSSSLPTPKLAGTQRDRRCPPRARWTMNHGIAAVAEDVADWFSSEKGDGEQQTPAPGRLHSLLHQKSPGKEALPLPPSNRLVRKTRVLHSDTENAENIQPRPREPRQDHSVYATASPLAKGSPTPGIPRKHAQDKPAPAPPPPRRLRDRPVTDLRREDFKVNPALNNGYTHAYSEVVRSKSDRAELAGCTDPNCCGRQFRAMAESELAAGGAGNVLSRVADIKMMEDYLGPAEAHRLVEMTREERAAVWLKAKVQDLADRLGRHRHRFARGVSPPGYWNPDFPSTQEIEERREEGERRERAVVEERWREAMLGSKGRWLFRDE